MSAPPREAKCAVFCWQSISPTPCARQSATSPQSGYLVYGQQYALETGLRMLLAPIVLIFFRGFCAKLFLRLSASELKGVPPILPYYLFAYCLGPSILAIIPVIGIPLAAVWIFVNMFIAAHKRMYMSTVGAFINTLITYLCGMGIVVGAYFAIKILWPWMMSPGLQAEPPPKPTTPNLYHAPPPT